MWHKYTAASPGWRMVHTFKSQPTWYLLKKPSAHTKAVHLPLSQYFLFLTAITTIGDFKNLYFIIISFH